MTRNVHMPESLAGLWEILDRVPNAPLYAGGTDLLVKLRALPAAFESTRDLVCLERIDELNGIAADGKQVSIGACAKLSHVQAHPAIQESFPVLARAIEVLGSPQIRNMGTIGGNICTASPAGDTLPPLYILDAVLELRARNSRRLVPLCEFISGPGKTLLAQGEIVSRIIIGKKREWNLQSFEKVSGRKSLAIAVASLAVVAGISDQGKIDAIRCAWGSIGPTIVISHELENFLTGKLLTQANLREASAIIRDYCCPIDDIRAGSVYRRAVAGNLLMRLCKNSGQC